MAKEMTADVIVTLTTHDFPPLLTVHTGGGHGLHPDGYDQPSENVRYKQHL